MIPRVAVAVLGLTWGRHIGTVLALAVAVVLVGAVLAAVASLATLSLVLPTFTTSRQGPEFFSAQLVFAAVASLVLHGMFVLTQTGPHRHFFLPVIADEPETGDRTSAPPTGRMAGMSLALLVVALCAVVGLAKVE